MYLFKLLRTRVACLTRIRSCKFRISTRIKLDNNNLRLRFFQKTRFHKMKWSWPSQTIWANNRMCKQCRSCRKTRETSIIFLWRHSGTSLSNQLRTKGFQSKPRCTRICRCNLIAHGIQTKTNITTRSSWTKTIHLLTKYPWCSPLCTCDHQAFNGCATPLSGLYWAVWKAILQISTLGNKICQLSN